MYSPTPRGGSHRAPRQQVLWPTRLLVTVLCLAVAAAAWLVFAGRGGSAPLALPLPGFLRPAPEVEPDPDSQLDWGPTVGELAAARRQVAGWSPERLAGQVLVGRYHGTDPTIPAAMVRDLHLAGVSLQSENVVDIDQVRATTAAVRAAVAADGRDIPPVIGVDQEGGAVAHLDGIATPFPAYAEAGAALEADRAAGRQVVREAASAAGLELRDLGFTWVYAPVADVDSGASDVIGSRAPSADPELAAAAVRASVNGFNDVGLVSTVKHFVGHGAVAADSHDEVPVLEEGLAALRPRDLWPFRAAVDAGAPAIMMGHVALTAVSGQEPLSMVPEGYELLADETGFEGLTITDSLGMGAVYGRDRPAVQALLAGADLLLMPADTEVAHRTLTAAIRSGEVPRRRIEEAAATVVAVQRWQARIAAGVPVPPDATERAATASARLEEAG